MKLISWNVNGLRSILQKGFLDFVQKSKPDILCLQETRTNPEEARLDLPSHRQYWNPAERAGYSGTAVFTRIEPLSFSCGIAVPKHDSEGRVLTLEFKKFYLVNVYTPNSKRDLSRLAYRAKEWDVDFLKFLKKLEKEKAVVFCGDLNVAHKEIDLTNPQANRRNHGFTDEERAGFSRLVQSGFLDTYREFTDEGGHYTWWSQFAKCRQRNIGWRIDYFCISSSLRPKLKDAFVLPEVMGSDHCPVGIDIEL